MMQQMRTRILRRAVRSQRRWLSSESKAEKTAEKTTEKVAEVGWFNNVHFWANAGAIAGWGMTGAAIYDASFAGPEVISMNMTGVMLVYSSLFARWAWIVNPRNLMLAACHASNVVAQCNQMRRALEHKLANGQEEEVNEIAKKAAGVILGAGAAIVGGPTIQAAIIKADVGPISKFAGQACFYLSL